MAPFIMQKAMQDLDLADNAKRVLAEGNHVAFDLAEQRMSDERFTTQFEAQKLADSLNEAQDALSWVVVKLTLAK